MSRSDLLEEVAGRFSVESGVFSALNPKVKVVFNSSGEYESLFPIDLNFDELDSLARVSLLSNEHENESTIAASLFGGNKGLRFDGIVGFYLETFVGHVTEGDFRSRGSSGGMASWIANELLRKRLVDGVVHMKCNSIASEATQKPLFKYGISLSASQLNADAGTKYYPGNLGSVLQQIKGDGKKYAFIGIPGFISELRLLTKECPDFADSVGYTIGLVCGHQKSAAYTTALGWEYGIVPGTMRKVSYRSFGGHRPANDYDYFFEGNSDDGRVINVRKPHTKFFVSNWGQGFFKKKFSDYTDDAFNETADIVLGDAWLPDVVKDPGGNNIVIVRNQELLDIVNQSISQKRVNLWPVDVNTIKRSQMGLIHHNRDYLPYRLALLQRADRWIPQLRTQPKGSLPISVKRLQQDRLSIATESHKAFEVALQLGSWETFYQIMDPEVSAWKRDFNLERIRKAVKKGPRRLGSRIFKKY